MLSMSEYSRICDNLCNQVTEDQLIKLKDNFRSEINSNRTFCRINSTKELFRVLEKRDILAPENEDALKKIRNLVKPSNISTGQFVQSPINNSLSPPKERVLPYTPTSRIEKVNELIRTEIGSNWKEFARSLSISEGYIDKLESRYRGDIREMVQEILNLQQENYSDNMHLWQVRLRNALECARRKDLSKKIDRIMIS